MTRRNGRHREQIDWQNDLSRNLIWCIEGNGTGLIDLVGKDCRPRSHIPTVQGTPTPRLFPSSGRPGVQLNGGDGYNFGFAWSLENPWGNIDDQRYEYTAMIRAIKDGTGSGWQAMFNFDNQFWVEYSNDQLYSRIHPEGSKNHGVIPTSNHGREAVYFISWNARVDGGRHILWIDGSERGTRASSGQTGISQAYINTNLYVGSFRAASEWWVGMLGDIRIWNRHFTPEEINRLTFDPDCIKKRKRVMVTKAGAAPPVTGGGGKVLESGTLRSRVLTSRIIGAA